MISLLSDGIYNNNSSVLSEHYVGNSRKVIISRHNHAIMVPTDQNIFFYYFVDLNKRLIYGQNLN